MNQQAIILRYTPRDGIDWQPAEIVREWTAWAEERGLLDLHVAATEVVAVSA